MNPNHLDRIPGRHRSFRDPILAPVDVITLVSVKEAASLFEVAGMSWLAPLPAVHPVPDRHHILIAIDNEIPVMRRGGHAGVIGRDA